MQRNSHDSTRAHRLTILNAPDSSLYTTTLTPLPPQTSNAQIGQGTSKKATKVVRIPPHEQETSNTQTVIVLTALGTGIREIKRGFGRHSRHKAAKEEKTRLNALLIEEIKSINDSNNHYLREVEDLRNRTKLCFETKISQLESDLGILMHTALSRTLAGIYNVDICSEITTKIQEKDAWSKTLATYQEGLGYLNATQIENFNGKTLKDINQQWFKNQELFRQIEYEKDVHLRCLKKHLPNKEDWKAFAQEEIANNHQQRRETLQRMETSPSQYPSVPVQSNQIVSHSEQGSRENLVQSVGVSTPPITDKPKITFRNMGILLALSIIVPTVKVLSENLRDVADQFTRPGQRRPDRRPDRGPDRRPKRWEREKSILVKLFKLFK